jgi:peptide methionine sulfoxide reductase msrA/msrB
MNTSVDHGMKIGWGTIGLVGFTALIAVLAAFSFMRANLAKADAPQPQNQGKDDMIQVHIIGPDGKLTGPVKMAKFELSDDEWRARFTPEQYAIVRGKGTEQAFCGTLLDNKKTGYYVCVGCRLPLFHSNAKFDSGTGWPSFFQPVGDGNVAEIVDKSHGMVRTEILCARCDGHLGHVFNDGPADKTGLRYCLNSESLEFVDEEKAMTLAENPNPTPEGAAGAPKVGDRLPVPAEDTVLTEESGKASAVLGGGCFWCTEAVFQEIDGVYKVTSGYAGGDPKRADYESVCTGTTGHAEVIEISYDPSKVTLGQLLRIFFATHDPTQLNRQGPDSGTQYRSAVFYADDAQKRVAEVYIQQLNEAGAFKKPIVTTLEKLEEFFPAEDYHQDYADKNPENRYIRMFAAPKVDKVRKEFSEQVKSE